MPLPKPGLGADMALPFPIFFDPAAAGTSRFLVTATVADEMTDPAAFLDLAAETTAMMLGDLGRFAGLVRPGAVLRSRQHEAGPRAFAVEIEFDRPRPDLQRMLINGIAAGGYDTDGTAFFASLRVDPREGGPTAPPEMLLPAPPPFIMTDAGGQPIAPDRLRYHQDEAVYAEAAGGYDSRGEDLMMVLSNLSESGCLADPNDQPAISDIATPITWPAGHDAEGGAFPARLGISRLAGGEFAVYAIAATIAAASLSPSQGMTLVIEPYEL